MNLSNNLTAENAESAERVKIRMGVWVFLANSELEAERVVVKRWAALKVVHDSLDAVLHQLDVEIEQKADLEVT